MARRTSPRVSTPRSLKSLPVAMRVPSRLINVALNAGAVPVQELDAHINDAAFAVQMVEDNATTGNIIDMPAAYHNGACGFSFADGHSEIKKWLDPRTVPPLKKRQEPLIQEELL